MLFRSSVIQAQIDKCKQHSTDRVDPYQIQPQGRFSNLVARHREASGSPGPQIQTGPHVGYTVRDLYKRPYGSLQHNGRIAQGSSSGRSPSPPLSFEPPVRAAAAPQPQQRGNVRQSAKRRARNQEDLLYQAVAKENNTTSGDQRNTRSAAPNQKRPNSRYARVVENTPSFNAKNDFGQVQSGTPNQPAAPPVSMASKQDVRPRTRSVAGNMQQDPGSWNNQMRRHIQQTKAAPQYQQHYHPLLRSQSNQHS